MLKKLNIFNSFIIISALALVFAVFAPLSLKVTFASDDPSTINGDDLLNVADVVQNGFVKKGSNYVLDVDYAKEKGLTTDQINNLREYLHSVKPSEVKEAINYSDDFKNEVKDYVKEHGKLVSLTSLNKAFAAGNDNALIKTFKAVLVGVVGLTIATKVVEDAYAYGLHTACHKWGAKYSAVKSACKATGHW
ncbi:hypothetical protein NST12_16930 [Bacillus sp. FSL W8-1127]|uniref:hypothetical protein n=1 Tax=Bacillus sp. FSL W8-1127 TaxID=2954710 RepID=UPI0030F645EF